jgi:hypothetical protein
MKAFWPWTIAGLLLLAGFAVWVVHDNPFLRDGSSVERAVVITPGDKQLEEEHALIAKHPEGATFPIEQALFCRRGRLYEKWTFGTASLIFILPFWAICRPFISFRHCRVEIKRGTIRSSAF